LSSGLPGISSARFGKEWRLLYTDVNSYLRVLDAGGKSQYLSSGQYGSTTDSFEWGPYIQLEGRRKAYPLRGAVRVAPGGGENPLVLIPEIRKSLMSLGVSTRLVLLQWDRREFVEKAGSQSSSRYLSGADFLSPDGFGKGGRIIASAIEKSGSAFTEKISRLVLFEAE
jgi:hypothetical protein